MEAPWCTICLDPVVENNGRSIAQLMCGHIFHLDCIGTAFNVRRIMRCPNCRATENRRWETFSRGNPTNCIMAIDMNHYHFNLQPAHYWNVISGFSQVYTNGSMAFLQILDPSGGEWLLVAPRGFDLIPTTALPVAYDYLSWHNNPQMGAAGQAPCINRIHFHRQTWTPPTTFPNSTYDVGSTSDNIDNVGGNIHGSWPVDEQFTPADPVANPTPWSNTAVNSGSSAAAAATYRPNIDNVGGNIHGNWPVEQFTPADQVINPTPWSSTADNLGSSAAAGGDSFSAATYNCPNVWHGGSGSSAATTYRPNVFWHGGSGYSPRDGDSDEGTSADGYNTWRSGSSSDQAPPTSYHQDRKY